LIEHNSLVWADPLKGKFRSFLLTSFKNYLCTEAERARCHKRGVTMSLSHLIWKMPRTVIGWSRQTI